MDSLKNLLDDYLGKKAPALPSGAKDFLVKAAPWLDIISLVITIPAILAYWGISAMFAPLMYYASDGRTMIFTIAISLSAAAVIVNIMALPGLFKKTKSGWNLMYYGVLISAVGSLLASNIVGAIISFLISMYLLFQVKNYYK